MEGCWFSMIPLSEDPALITESTTLSYFQLQETIDQVKPLLGKSKQLIFCFCENSLSIIATYLAALQSNHAICLLDDKIEEPAKIALIDRYKPHLVISKRPISSFEVLDSPFSDLTFQKGIGTELHPKLQLLLSTSGTTGSPKLIRLTKDNLLSNACSIAQYLQIDKKERAIASLPIHYSYGLSVLNSHLFFGGSVVLTDSSIVQKPFWNTFEAHQCTSFAGVPYTYQLLDRLNFEKNVPPTLKTMTQAGGKLDNQLIAKFSHLMAQRKGKFFVMYGQTEATARISYLDPASLPEKIGSIGKAIPGGTLSLSEEGELIYSGKNVMMGYAECASDLALGDQLQGKLLTGDLGCVDKEGFYTITGRKKRISKVYGLRINLDEVEQLIKEFGPVAVTGNDEKLTLHFENKVSENFSRCVNLLKEQYHLHPSTFICHTVDSFPLTSSGKVDMNTLHEMANAT